MYIYFLASENDHILLVYMHIFSVLIIGFSVASGPALLLLVLGIISIRRKIKEHRIKVLKQKHFNQNRGRTVVATVGIPKGRHC